MLEHIPLIYYALAGLFNFIASFALSFFVFYKNPKSRTNQTFSFWTLAVAGWSLCYFLWLSTEKSYLAEFYLRTLMLFVIFIPSTFTHFILTFLKINYDKRINIGNYLISILLGCMVYSRLLARDIGPFLVFPFWLKPAFLFSIHSIHFFTNVIYSHFLMLRAIRHQSGIFRNQVFYVFVGTVIGYSAGAINYLTWYRIPIPPFLNPLNSISVAFISYAILKYRLMDIKVALTRTGIFVVVYTMVLGIPFWIGYTTKSWLPSTGLAVFLATLGPFIYIYLDRKAEQRLLKEQRRYQETLKQASVGMTRIRNLKRLLDLITHIVTKTVKITYAGIYLYDREANEYVLQVCRDKGRTPIPKLTADNPLIQRLINNRQPLIYEEVRLEAQTVNHTTEKSLEENMRLLTASVVIPSFLEDRLLGFIVLGEKASGQIYTPDDLNVFQVLAAQSALAIEETKQMQEQIGQAEKMATIGTMADGLSHQINNRFYALSLIAADTIDTIKLTDTSQCSPEVKEMLDQINHALERIKENVIQGGEVVKGVLKYTRKGEEGLEPLALDQILDATLDMLKYKINLSEIDIIRGYAKDLPKIKGNQIQLQEVFFNFCDNAYDAICERKVTLKEEGYRGKINFSAQPKDTMLEITIEDNGMGIKEDFNKKVFTPFFTTKTSSHKGTGLGLYVIKKIITDNHKGRVSFKSAYKVGTRFIVELPLA